MKESWRIGHTGSWSEDMEHFRVAQLKNRSVDFLANPLTLSIADFTGSISRDDREKIPKLFWVILVAAAWPRRRSFEILGVFEFQDFRVLSWRRDKGPVCKLYGLVWVKAKLLLAWTRILDSFIFVIFKILMGVGFENYGLGKKKKKIVLLFSEKNNSIWILLRAFLPTKGTIQWSIGKFYIHLPPRF